MPKEMKPLQQPNTRQKSLFTAQQPFISQSSFSTHTNDSVQELQKAKEVLAKGAIAAGRHHGLADALEHVIGLGLNNGRVGRMRELG